MSHTIKLSNFSVTTQEPLSSLRKSRLVSAVLNARSLVRNAQDITHEALVVLTTGSVADLSPTFRDHFKSLFRVQLDGDLPRALSRAGAALSTLYRGLTTEELKFIEYGSDWVTNVGDFIARRFGQGIYAPGDVAMVRAFTLTGGYYMGASTFDACVTTGKVSGNPNEVAIKVERLDRAIDETTDTVIHESTHKFLGTTDEGMRGAGLGFLAGEPDGILGYHRDNPGLPLPFETPGFQAMSTDEAMGNAYLLTGYIQYMPQVRLIEYANLLRLGRNNPLGSATDLGQTLRAGLPRRPPGMD